MKKPLAVAAPISAFAVLLLGSGASETGGRRRPDSSFLSVEFPCTPSDQSGIRETLVGDVHHNTLGCMAGDASVSITASVLPPAITWLTTDNMLYRRARYELLRSYDATQTRWSTCHNAGHPCRFLHYVTGDNRTGRARLYLGGGILVVINATYAADEDTAYAFLDSSD